MLIAKQYFINFISIYRLYNLLPILLKDLLVLMYDDEGAISSKSSSVFSDTSPTSSDTSPVFSDSSSVLEWLDCEPLASTNINN